MVGSLYSCVCACVCVYVNEQLIKMSIANVLFGVWTEMADLFKKISNENVNAGLEMR